MSTLDNSFSMMTDHNDALQGCASATPAKDLHHLAHAIDRVSSDVWYLIFQHLTTLSDNAGSANGILSMRHGVWPLSQVCHQWRSMVLDMPNLWSSIECNHPVPDQLSTPLYWNIGAADAAGFLLYRLNIQLQRSRNSPLHFICVGFPTEDNASQAIFRPVYEVLLDHACQWEEVHFSDPHPVLDDVIQKALDAVVALDKPLFPILQTLKWQSRWQWGHHALSPVYAPQLETLFLYSTPREERSQILIIDRLPSRLKRLELTNYRGVGGMAVFLKSSPTLQDLTITLGPAEFDLQNPQAWRRLLWPPVDLSGRMQLTFKQLRKMRLLHRLGPIPVFKHLLPCAKTPALETLEISVGYGANEARELANFLLLSHCSLKTLILRCHGHVSSNMMALDLISLLSATPQLEYLDISYLPKSIGDPIIDFLSLLGQCSGEPAGDSPQVQFCPDLKTLRLRTLEEYVAGGVYFAPLGDMISVRWKGVDSPQSLRHVYLESVGSWNDDGEDEKRLQNFKEAGLDIAIWRGREGYNYLARRRLL